MNYIGTIIEESLKKKDVLKDIVVLSRIESITPEHKTPWLLQWTLDTVEIPEEKADLIAQKLSLDLDDEHPWYADFKNDQYHYIIYRGKVFKVNMLDLHTID